METTITNYEVSFTIRFNFYPGQPQTWDDPGYPEEIEIIEVLLYGEQLSIEQEKRFIEDYDLDKIESVCLEQVQTDQKSKLLDAAELADESRQARCYYEKYYPKDFFCTSNFIICCIKF